MFLSFLYFNDTKVIHFCKNSPYHVRNCIKTGSEAIYPYDEKREIGETKGGNLLAVTQILLFRGSYILKIVVAVFGVQADAPVHFVDALGQFHNDDGALLVYQFFYFLGGSTAGYHGQPFFLAGYVQTGAGAGGNEGGNARNVADGNAVRLQLLIYIMYGRVETGIPFGNDAHLLSIPVQCRCFGVDAVVGIHRLLALLAHREREAANIAFRDIQLLHDVRRP